ncbi:MAG TPA: 5-oxoprolinase subunit PxpB [Gracilimonas sp.]|uniref:5-oxoprolinase subunit PxpB n=1 Tax=Gracilimonas sp. TaxID=1974203 RepID=UPI002DB4A13C|nr:5-oxoprolinase subunit PxpB [Gracilimonas sp.]
MSGSLQINGIDWQVSLLGEQVLVIKPEGENADLSLIHESARLLEKADLKGLTDIISTYDSIALIFDRLLEEPDSEAEKLQPALNGLSSEKISPQKHRVPVCYELGLDWQQVEEHTGLSRQEIIKKHSTSKYVTAMMGFIPGFIYLDGLDKKISCPRKANPRTKIPEGSVGIAGEQTGVYSQESPGGWQIIGRTPDSFFDANKEPPSQIEPGDIVEFYEISEAEFRKLKENRGN